MYRIGFQYHCSGTKFLDGKLRQQTDRSAPKPAKKKHPLENKYAMPSHATWENLAGEQHGPNGFALHPTAPASEWLCKALNSASHN